jgi:outer membrane receptor protein involved in Fe transport
MKNLSVVGNVSIMKSQMTISGIFNQNKTNPLQNQSPYLINAGLYYQNDSTGTQVTVLLNTFGSRVSILGTGDFPNIGELSRNMLDITINQKIYKWFSLTVGVQNLLNAPFRFYQDTNHDGKFKTDGSDKEMTRYYMGAYYSAGLKAVF